MLSLSPADLKTFRNTLKKSILILVRIRRLLVSFSSEPVGRFSPKLHRYNVGKRKTLIRFWCEIYNVEKNSAPARYLMNGITDNDQILKVMYHIIFIPRHTLVSGYYVIPFGVCPSVQPSVRPSVRAHHFRSIT